MSLEDDIASQERAAKQELQACEQEISGIKGLLRAIGPQTDDDDQNKLTVRWIKVDGLPEAAQPRISLQLSSPVEEAEISSLADPLDDSKGSANFKGVETGQACLVCSAFDQDIPLGTSEPCDLAPICKINVLDTKEHYETEQLINIMAPEFKHEEEPQDDKQDAESQDESSSSKPTPICTLTLKFTFTPSKKDRREELYELLNQCSQRKAAAVERLRETAVAAHRQQMAGDSRNPTSSSQVVPKPSTQAVRSGFLNKPKKEPSKVMKLYDKYLGPQSMLRLYFPIAQNYLIFGGFVVLMHYKGQMLALPAPV